jgi:hypothetical protein
MNVHKRKFTRETEGSPEHKLDVAFELFFSYCKCVFKAASRTFTYLFFTGAWQAMNFKTIYACTENTVVII